MSAESTSPTVVEGTLDPAILSGALSATADLIVLPLEYDDEGMALYSEPSVITVKTLRADGIDAAFLDSPDSRMFEVKKGNLETLVATLVIGIASNAAWDALKVLVRARAARLKLTFVELRDGNKRRGQAWTVEGDSDAVLAAIDKLRDDDAVT